MVMAWRDEFRTAVTMGCEEYAKRNWNLLDDRGRAWTYLCVYGALQVAVAKNGTDDGMATYWSNGCNLPGGLCGPYWSPTTADDRLNGVFTASGAVLSKVPLIKFASSERSTLVDNQTIWRRAVQVIWAASLMTRSRSSGQWSAAGRGGEARALFWSGGTERAISIPPRSTSWNSPVHARCSRPPRFLHSLPLLAPRPSIRMFAAPTPLRRITSEADLEAVEIPRTTTRRCSF